VTADAANLLERELPLALVRRCDESEQGLCGWLFVDETRNHSRRFCSMKDCGNRAKQRRYWKRQREA
jgi:predicted RNA-binding Zn ribbon-like protein